MEKMGYDEGREEGKEEGKEEERHLIIRKLSEKGFAPEKVADTLELPIDEVRKAMRP